MDIFKKANLSIVRACERICDTPLIKMTEVNSAMDLFNIKCVLEQYRSGATVAVMQLYTGVIDMILVVYQGFEEIMDYVCRKIHI